MNIRKSDDAKADNWDKNNSNLCIDLHQKNMKINFPKNQKGKLTEQISEIYENKMYTLTCPLFLLFPIFFLNFISTSHQLITKFESENVENQPTKDRSRYSPTQRKKNPHMPLRKCIDSKFHKHDNKNWTLWPPDPNEPIGASRFFLSPLIGWRIWASPFPKKVLKISLKSKWKVFSSFDLY